MNRQIASLIVGFLLAGALVYADPHIVTNGVGTTGPAGPTGPTGPAGPASITSGTTTITSGADKSVCFDDTGVINCADATLKYTKGTGSLAATTFVGAFTGNASTATALAANPTNCSAGNYPLGIDASGNVESCTAANAGTITGSGTSPKLAAWSSGTAIGDFAGSTSCTTGQAATALDASGNPVCNSFINGSGTAPDLAIFTGSGGGVGNYAGTGTSAGQVIAAIDSAGGATFVPAGSTNITNVTGGVFLIPNKSTTGTTLNKIAKLDTTASPATAIIATTGDTTNVLGVVVSGAGTTGSATILLQGQAPCQFDGTATVGDYVIVSTTTGGDCHDAASSTVLPTGVAVLGIVAESGTSASPRAVDFGTPEVAGTSSTGGKGTAIQTNGSNTKAIANFNATTPAITGNNVNVTWQASTSSNTTSISAGVDPATFVNLGYSGTLVITDISTVTNGDATISHRYTRFSAGSSSRTATMPAATGSGAVYDICKIDSGSGTVVVTRASSDAIVNKSTGSATTVTLTGQGACETMYDQASAEWVGRGDGT